MGYNKLVIGDDTKFDLSSDTITAAKLLNGTTAHGPDGEAITGTYKNSSNTANAILSIGIGRTDGNGQITSYTRNAAGVTFSRTNTADGSFSQPSNLNTYTYAGLQATKAGRYAVQYRANGRGASAANNGAGLLQVDGTNISTDTTYSGVVTVTRSILVRLGVRQYSATNNGYYVMFASLDYLGPE